MGLGVAGNYVWCLVVVIIFMGCGQAEVGGGHFKIIIWSYQATYGDGGSFYWGFSQCNSVKSLIRYLFSLYYGCFTCFASIGR